MHASIWTFRGDPDRLLGAYEAMLGEVDGANMNLHLCLRAPDGIVIVDTCPTQAAFERFVTDPNLCVLRERHGVPEPERIEDFPVHLAFVGGHPVT